MSGVRYAPVMRLWPVAVWSGFSACVPIELPPLPNCVERTAYWADEDGDGVGDPGRVYLGCSAPDGWVDVPPASADPDLDPDTADSGGEDTDTADTAPESGG